MDLALVGTWVVEGWYTYLKQLAQQTCSVAGFSSHCCALPSALLKHENKQAPCPSQLALCANLQARAHTGCNHTFPPSLLPILPGH